MSNDKDKKVAEKVIRELLAQSRAWLGEEFLQDGIKALSSRFATIRKEARREAFADTFKELCPDCAEGDDPTFDKQARWYYHGSANQEVGCSASKLRIMTALEQAAKEEGNDG